MTESGLTCPRCGNVAEPGRGDCARCVAPIVPRPLGLTILCLLSFAAVPLGVVFGTLWLVQGISTLHEVRGLAAAVTSPLAGLAYWGMWKGSRVAWSLVHVLYIGQWVAWFLLLIYCHISSTALVDTLGKQVLVQGLVVAIVLGYLRTHAVQEYCSAKPSVDLDWAAGGPTSAPGTRRRPRVLTAICVLGIAWCVSGALCGAAGVAGLVADYRGPGGWVFIPGSLTAFGTSFLTARLMGGCLRGTHAAWRRLRVMWWVNLAAFLNPLALLFVLPMCIWVAVAILLWAYVPKSAVSDPHSRDGEGAAGGAAAVGAPEQGVK